jgi:hypothetical protein
MYLLQKSDMLAGNSGMIKQSIYVYCSNGQWQLLLLNTPNLSTDMQAFALHNRS